MSCIVTLKINDYYPKIDSIPYENLVCLFTYGDFFVKIPLIQKSNKDYGYVKVNAETSYGMRLMIKYRGRFVPYIVLTNSKTKKSVNVNHSCVMNELCLIRAMKNFKG